VITERAKAIRGRGQMSLEEFLLSVAHNELALVHSIFGVAWWRRYNFAFASEGAANGILYLNCAICEARMYVNRPASILRRYDKFQALICRRLHTSHLLQLFQISPGRLPVRKTSWLTLAGNLASTGSGAFAGFGKLSTCTVVC